MTGADDAIFRRYNRWWSRFEQPDPYDGSYDLSDPQSFNRYAYVQNDPVSFVDPSGLDPCTDEQGKPVDCGPPLDPKDSLIINHLEPLLSPYYVPLQKVEEST